MHSSNRASQKGKAKVEAMLGPTRKARILVGACGAADAVEFEKVCRCFGQWAIVRAVLTISSLSYIDVQTLFNEVVDVYRDENEWLAWNNARRFVLLDEFLKWADFMVIAPLSANTLAKIVGGLCDNLLTCIVRAWDYVDKPPFVAPSMNTFIWRNPLTQVHYTVIDELGINLIPTVTHVSATGVLQYGVMAELSTINSTVKRYYYN